MKLLSFAFVLSCLAPYGLADVTISGDSAAVAEFSKKLQKENLIQLRGSASQELFADNIIVSGSFSAVEKNIKSLSALEQSARSKFKQKFPSAKFGDIYELNSPISFEGTKEIKRITSFVVTVPVSSIDDLIEYVVDQQYTLTAIEPDYSISEARGEELMTEAIQDLKRQKSYYENAFSIKLEFVRFFPTSDDSEADDEDVIFLSPFSVYSGSASVRRSSMYSKSDPQQLVKTVSSTELVRTIDAVYKITE